MVTLSLALLSMGKRQFHGQDKNKNPLCSIFFPDALAIVIVHLCTFELTTKYYAWF